VVMGLDLGPDGPRWAMAIPTPSSSCCHRMAHRGSHASPVARGRQGRRSWVWRWWPSSPPESVGRLAAVLSHPVPAAIGKTRLPVKIEP
jgi:hypothetical protein